MIGLGRAALPASIGLVLLATLGGCKTDPATSRRPVTAGVTSSFIYVCYDASKDLIYGNPREVAARGCLQDDRRVSVEEAARLKKDYWLALPPESILSSELACRDTVTGRIYGLPLKMMSEIELKCVPGDEELTHHRAGELLKEERHRELRSPTTERAARDNMDVIRRLNDGLTERRFADVDGVVGELQDMNEIVTAINWLGRKVDDGAGAAHVRAHIALLGKAAEKAKADQRDAMADVSARMAAYLYLITAVDAAKCRSNSAAAESLTQVVMESRSAFEHLASVSRARRDGAIAYAVGKEQQLALRRPADAWICRHDANSTAEAAEIYSDESRWSRLRSTYRAVFGTALMHLIELKVHESSRL